MSSRDEAGKRSKLRIVWNRDKPRYQLSVQGFEIIRSSEIECLNVAVDSLERALEKTRKKRFELAGRVSEGKGAER